MSQSQTIREGIAAALKPLNAALASAYGTGCQVLAFEPGNPQVPCVYVADGPIDYELAMQAVAKYEFIVFALFPFTSDEGPQHQLDALRDPTGTLSIKALVEADVTLGGACSDATVTKASAPARYARGEVGSVLLGAEWTVEVLPK